jgi:hypothetical protein
MLRNLRLSSISMLVPLLGGLGLAASACSTADVTDPPISSAREDDSSDVGLVSDASSGGETPKESDTRSSPGDEPDCPRDRRCTTPGARTCRGSAPYECRARSATCNLWMKVETCSDNETCQKGACRADCFDQCPERNRTRCLNERVQTCGDFDEDTCLEWDSGMACESKQTCSDGRCVQACSDRCEQGTKRCANDTVQVCADSDEDDCFEWIEGAVCKEGTTCSSGSCVVECRNQCGQGETRCKNDEVETCDDYDDDSCLEWAITKTCGDSQVCSEGQCTRGCSDQCSMQGAKRCSNDDVQTCGDYDMDACLEWGDTTPCGSGKTCSSGQCVGGCNDQCSQKNATRCNNGEVETCGDYDMDACLEWGNATDCGSGKTCSNGSCTPASGCSDQCGSKGTRQCAGHGYEACSDSDGDGCLEWSAKQYCSAGELCQSGSCQAVSTPPSQPVISEVFYDQTGADTDVFIEIAGPKNTDLSGFSLVGVNGNDGSEYADIVLKGTTDSNGLFLVAYDQASSTLKSKAQQVSSEADLQNAPDNVQLKWGSTVVDALGYGSFGGSATFAGEGMPAPDVDAGESLARYGTTTDADDNSADFYVNGSPSPGQLNAKVKP